MQIHGQLVNDLKSAGHYFAAGALAASMGHDRRYGCHFGMRSEKDAATDTFYRGFDAFNVNTNGGR